MDSVSLRQILRPLVIALSGYNTHAMLPEVCQRLGLPDPNFGGSKRERMTASFDELADEALPSVATKFLQFHPPPPSDRNRIEDLLWADLATPAISKKCRREVARVLPVESLYADRRRFEALLERLWVIGSEDPIAAIFSREDNSLRAGINQHIHGNSGCWSVEEFFDQLGAFDATNKRFALFLEGLASADVHKDEVAQRAFVKAVNKPLSRCGLELRETDIAGGYPVFSIVSTHEVRSGGPKNLIFASPIKPDLRFIDALNNDIEIVTNADKVLVYDRPISPDGLRWRDLQAWWAESQQIAGEGEAKRTLYQRLRGSLPRNSPPQTVLFDAFHQGFNKAIPDLPALLPEVWLHWDPKTVRERGALALTRFRMDFLLLLPQRVRVVIEVDGKSHYANTEGRADGSRYSAMVRADRELKLAGYQVFHFGAEELLTRESGKNVRTFFESLFKEYGVTR